MTATPTPQSAAPRKRVRVAIAGVGNCASSLVQGVEFYRDADPTERVPGLMHVELGGYHVGDVTFVAALDVDADKAARPRQGHLGEHQQRSVRRRARSRRLVQRGPTFDGLASSTEVVEESPAERSTAQARDSRADVLVSYLPVGSEEAQRPLRAGRTRRGSRFPTRSRCSSRATPSGRRSSPTRACRSSATTSRARSAPRSRTACWPACSRTAARDRQHVPAHFGGNMDFRACSSASACCPRRCRRRSRSRARSTRASRRRAHIGPSDHVPWLNDRKWAYIRLEAATSATYSSTSSSSSRSGTPQLGGRDHRRRAVL